ncbi:helix-turn-helix domain-containing protein [Chloroflexota bacterium]
MSEKNLEHHLDKKIKDYSNDPEFIAEGLSIKIIEEALHHLSNRKLSQTWLAEKTGVSRAHISRILNAPPNMTLLSIAKIAVALGLTPDICLDSESNIPFHDTADTFGYYTGITSINEYGDNADTVLITAIPPITRARCQNTLFSLDNFNNYSPLFDNEKLPNSPESHISLQETTV